MPEEEDGYERGQEHSQGNMAAGVHGLPPFCGEGWFSPFVEGSGAPRANSIKIYSQGLELRRFSPTAGILLISTKLERYTNFVQIGDKCNLRRLSMLYIMDVP